MARIVLVEPDTILAQTFMRAMALHGHEVTWHTQAQAAVMALDAMDKKPDVLVLELQLTLHNGIELLYELRSYADLQQLPIIIWSYVPEQAFSGRPDAKAFTISDYFYKPTTKLADLQAAIEQALVTVA